MINPVYITKAFSGQSVMMDKVAIPFHTAAVGELEVISGWITACDPFVEPATPAFAQRVPVGEFPVTLAIAELKDDHERVGFARVDFSDHPIVLWKPALVLGLEEIKLERVEDFGYAVDSAIGCFMDSKVAAQFDQRFYEDPAYFDEILDASQITEQAWSLINVRPNPLERGNMIAFSSGWGDGVYGSYFGYSAEGEPQCLVTDFEIVFEESEQEQAAAQAEYLRKNRAKPWWQLW